MDGNTKGLFAQEKVILRAIEKGVTVSRPICETCRYDLILDDGKLWRVQVKYAGGKSSHTEGAVMVALRTWNHKGPTKKNKVYSSTEVDALLVYVPRLDKVLWFDAGVFAGKTALSVRVTPTKSNQRKRCHFAESYIW